MFSSSELSSSSSSMILVVRANRQGSFFLRRVRAGGEGTLRRAGQVGGNSPVRRPSLEGDDWTRTSGMGCSNEAEMVYREGDRWRGAGGGVGDSSTAFNLVVTESSRFGDMADLARARNCMGKGEVSDLDAGMRWLGEDGTLPFAVKGDNEGLLKRGKSDDSFSGMQGEALILMGWMASLGGVDAVFDISTVEPLVESM